MFTVIYSSLHQFIWNHHNDQLLVGLSTQLVEHCTSIAEVMGSNPIWAWTFFRSYFHYYLISVHDWGDCFHINLFICTLVHDCEYMKIICVKASIFTSLSVVRIYEFHIHVFTVIYSSLHRIIWNQHNDHLSVGLLAQLIEYCTGITKVMGSNPVQAWIFF